MRIPIFNLSNKSTYKDEYIKMIRVLNSKCLTYNKKTYNYFDFINTYLFNNWKFRGTYLDVYDYLDFLGVKINSHKITESSFLNLLEFILNMNLLLSNIKLNIKLNTKAHSVLYHNIPLILEHLGYQAYSLDDKIIVSAIDTDYDDLRELVSDDIFELIISYKNINNNGIKTKRIILDKLFSTLEDDAIKYKSYNSSLYNTVKLVVNKMGIRYNIDKKYINLSNYKLRKYYDYAFSIICYLIKTENILKYKDSIRGE